MDLEGSDCHLYVLRLGIWLELDADRSDGQLSVGLHVDTQLARNHGYQTAHSIFICQVCLCPYCRGRRAQSSKDAAGDTAKCHLKGVSR